MSRIVCLRMDYLLLIFSLLGLYGAIKNDYYSHIDSLLPAIIIFLMISSKRNNHITGRGFRGLLAFILSAIFFMKHWPYLLNAGHPSILFYLIILLILFIFGRSNFTTNTLTIIWFVYYILLFTYIITEHSVKETLYYVSHYATLDAVVVNYFSILLLSVIGGLLVDREIRFNTSTS